MNKPARILIVDDEPNVRLVFRTTLESEGYELIETQDGQLMLDTIASSRVDLVLLDLHMPGMDGMETLRGLRTAGLDIPVVMITAHGSIPHAVEALKLGAIDFLSKPISPDALRKAVAQVLDRHEPATALPLGQPGTPEPVTAASPFAANLMRAKRALNHRWFDEAEGFLKQAIALNGSSAEAHNLMGALHELRNEHDESYRSYKAALKADRQYEPASHNMTRYYERFTFGRSQIELDIGAS